MKVLWKWIKRNERTISMGVNFIAVGIAVSLMLNGDYKEACHWFLMGFIWFCIDFLINILKRNEVSE